MFEKMRDYLAKLIASAFHTVTKSFRLFLPLFIAVFLVECILFTVFLSFENNIALRHEKIAESYDYHIMVSGLDESEMLLLRNDDRTVSRNDMCFEVIKTVRYDSTYYDPSYTVYIEILTGNKNYGIFGAFIDDSLETNYNAMRLRYHDVFGTDEKPNTDLSIYFSPLYTEEEDADALQSLRFWLLLAAAAASAVILIALYKIYINNKKFVFGLYSAFGANARNLRTQSMAELLLIALFLLLPSYYITSLLCKLLYYIGGSFFHFSAFSLSAWLIVLLLMVPILFVAIYVTMKPVAATEPMKLIMAEENANLVSSPRGSVSLLKLPFPFGYEGLSIFRFRRHHISLAITSALLGVVFVLSFYLSSFYANGASIRYQTDPDFSVRFSSTTLTEEHIEIFQSVQNVDSVYIAPSTTHADDLAALMIVSKENVSSPDGLAEDEQNGIFYTGDFRAISGGTDIASYISDIYQVEGDTSLLTNDTHNILIGKTFENSDAFSFEIGDRITVAIANRSDDGKVVYRDENAQKIQDVTGRHYWEAMYEKLSFRYETFTVVGVIQDYPSGAQGVPIVMHPQMYQNLTGSLPAGNTLTIQAEQDITMQEFLTIEDTFRSIASKLGNCTVDTSETFFENRIERLYCYDLLIVATLSGFLIFIPLIWFYSQTLFFRKREKEFYILNAISAPLGKIRALYLYGSVMMLPIALLSLLFSGILCGALFLFFERFLPNVLQISGIVSTTVSVPPFIYVIGVLVTLASCIISALIPYFGYKHRFFSEITANTFHDES